MAAEVLINNFTTTLAAQLLAAATSMTLQSGDGAILRTKGGAGNFFRAVMASGAGVAPTGEIILVTIPASGDICTIARQQESTSASPTMASGSLFASVVTAGGTIAWLTANIGALVNVANGLAGLDANGTLSVPIIQLPDTFSHLSNATLYPTALQAGQMAFATDTKKIVIGDGTTNPPMSLDPINGTVMFGNVTLRNAWTPGKIGQVAVVFSGSGTPTLYIANQTVSGSGSWVSYNGLFQLKTSDYVLGTGSDFAGVKAGAPSIMIGGIASNINILDDGSGGGHSQTITMQSTDSSSISFSWNQNTQQLEFNSKIASFGFANSAAQAVVNGASSGNVTFSQPDQGTSKKSVIAYAAALVGAAVYTFPAPFTHVPMLVGSLAGIATATTTTLTLTGSTSTGFVEAIGY